MSATAAAPPDRPDPDRPGSSQPGPGRLPYIPALDGLRGVFVVLGPLLYHARPESIRGGPDILPGGILSLDLFFVLSSFLIVSIALREWDGTGRIDLVAYAGRRVRRLAPALLLALTGVTLYLVWADAPDIVPRWTGAIVSALTYSANWHEIFVGASYFEQFENPSPLKHVWSFAIEEQFYLFAPLFVIAGCAWFGPRRRWLMLAAAIAGAVASAAWMARLHTPGDDPSRAYYGTDTRAQALFVGIALAVAVRIAGPPRTVRGRTVLAAAVYPALAVYLWMITSVSERDHWMFERGGFLLIAVVSAVIIYGMAQPAAWSPAHRFFVWRPVRWSGRISYGLYLYHWPIYLLVTGERAGTLFGTDRIDGYQLLAVHLVLTFAVAAASFHLVERPVVERRWPALGRPVTLAWGAFASTAAVAVILSGLLLANSTRPVRVEQVLVPVASPAEDTEGADADRAGPAGKAPDGSGAAVEAGSGSVAPTPDASSADGPGKPAGDTQPADGRPEASHDAASESGQDSGPSVGGTSSAGESVSAPAEGDSGGGAGAATADVSSSGSVGGEPVGGILSRCRRGASTGSVTPSDADIDGAGRAATATGGAVGVDGASGSGGAEGTEASSGSGGGTASGAGAAGPGQPVRVLVVGDSVAAQVATSLREWSEDNPGCIVLFDDSHLGCTVGRYGLKRLPEGDYGPVGDVCSNWGEPVGFDEVADTEVVSWPTAVEVFAPDVIVAHISPWDVLDRIVPGVVDDWASIGDPVYDAYIRSEYAAASELLTAAGATLYWLQGAVLNRVPAFDDHAERIRGLNLMVAEGAAKLTDRRIVLLDYPSFIGEVGSERELAVRRDGVHLSEQGMAEVAPWLIEIIGADHPG